MYYTLHQMPGPVAVVQFTQQHPAPQPQQSLYQQQVARQVGASFGVYIGHSCHFLVPEWLH